MPKYAVLVRGVNLKKRNRLVMAEFRDLLEGLGHSAVTTYLNSGNAIVEAPGADPARLAGGIREALRDTLGLDVGVVVRSGPELAAVVEGNPFEVADPAAFHVAFLSEQPRRAPEEEGCHLGDRALYFDSAGSKAAEALLRACRREQPGLVVTARNWRTTLALAERATVER